MYISLVQSIISYDIEIWGCRYDIDLNKLKVNTNKIITFILKLSVYINTDFWISFLIWWLSATLSKNGRLEYKRYALMLYWQIKNTVIILIV
jgi:hypothetical protein